jgi:CheY-like chemotaxis protein
VSSLPANALAHAGARAGSRSEVDKSELAQAFRQEPCIPTRLYIVSAAQVLIVDDNEDAARSLALLLELEDIEAIWAPDAASALALLEHTSPPLLLVDIGLPGGMNGFQLAQRLRQLPGTRRAALIALSGSEQMSMDTAHSVFDQYWTKPFDPKKLLEAVQAVLARLATVSD